MQLNTGRVLYTKGGEKSIVGFGFLSKRDWWSLEETAAERLHL